MTAPNTSSAPDLGTTDSTTPQHQSYNDFLRTDFDQLFKLLNLEERQRHFLRSRWLDQVLWMEKKATDSRNWYRRLRLSAIAIGIIVPIMISINTNIGQTSRNTQLNQVINIIAIILSGTSAVSLAVEDFFRFGERWFHYRRTVESLKAQGWQFSQLSGYYRRFATHQEAFPVFADQVEELIQRDVEQYVTQMTKKDKQEEEEPQTTGEKEE